MAHLITGYAGHAHIRSADEGAFNASILGAGQYVMNFGNKFSGSIVNNNTVRILDGDGLMFGRHFRIEPNTYEDLTIETGTAGKNRIDLICAVYEKNAEDETETVELQVIKGAETTGTATAPEYVEGNIIDGAFHNEMPLYKVTLEGVVLSDIEPLFELMESHESIRERMLKANETLEEKVDALIRYKDFDFSGSSVAAKGTGFASISGIGISGYTPVSVAVMDGNQVGNGMIYTATFNTENVVYVRVENLHGANAYEMTGKVRVSYVKA
jgi:hypothetical protein